MSTICKESFEDIVAVYPILAGGIEYQVPFGARKRNYTLSELGVTAMATLTAMATDYYSIGEDYTNENVVELEEQESSLKSATKDTIAGRIFDVTLSLIIKENTDKSANLMDTLMANRHDFVIQLANSEFLLLRTEENAYTCKGEENFAKSYQQKLTISIQNLNGIQRIQS